MLRQKNQKTYQFQRIANLLATRTCASLQYTEYGSASASVALILRQSDDYDIEILFIQRAAHDRDPWSGHIAFPGGKREEGELVCQTACRETLEEVGMDLDEGCYLGRLSDIMGSNLPVSVACCVYGIEQKISDLVLSDEVTDAFWIRIADLRDRGRHHQAPVSFDERSFKAPAIRLPGEGKPVLWGITYHLVMQFLELIELIEL